MKTPDTLPDLRHLNHSIWNRHKDTSRLYLALIDLAKKSGDQLLDTASVYAVQKRLGITDSFFCESLGYLLLEGCVKLPGIFIVDPREEVPDEENSKPLILGEGSSK